ncbi:carbon-nitrogen hydrolase family protein [Sphingomonas sp. RS2018]
MRAALLQMTAGIDPAANARTVADAIDEAAAHGAAMLFTPEMSNLIDRDRARAAASVVDEGDDPVLIAAREGAARTGVWVHLGSIAVRGGDGRFANRSFVIDGSGEIHARYDKLHLFDAAVSGGDTWRESAAYAPGAAAVVVATPLGRLGLSICYDLRFADLYRALTDAGAELLAIPAAFTVPTGAAHWHVLMRARAIEGAAFVIAAAQCGRHADGRETYGHSLVVDPWGEVLLDMGDAAGVAIVDVDLARGTAARERVPVLSHRRAIPPVTVIA